MITKVTGLADGRFIAAYACPVGELGERFVGCFKVYRERPLCFCESGHVHSSIAPGEFHDAEAALQAALQSAGAPADEGSPPTRQGCVF